MKIIGIIQARMGSTRLPGKVLKDLSGEPMLVRVVNRTRMAETLDEVIVATTSLLEDDLIEHLCFTRGIPCRRGSETDLLDRYYRVAKEWKPDAVVRITSDCPMIDPGIIDLVAGEFLAHQPEVHYASNFAFGRSQPVGLDTEIIRFDALERAWREDDNPEWREHATPYIYKHPDLFALLPIRHEEDLSHHRWTVDTPEDYELARRIYQHFGDDTFSWTEVMELINRRLKWQELNRHVVQKTV